MQTELSPSPALPNLEESFRNWNVEKDVGCGIDKLVAEQHASCQDIDAGHAEPHCHRHIPALDALRGLAILFVTFYRFRYGPEDESSAGIALEHVLNLGSRGVDLFFVLSGFLITGILLDSKHRDPHFFRNFYSRRSLRIFPLYFGALALFLLLLPAIASLPAAFEAAQSQQFWLWIYCSNIYMSIEGSWCFGALDHFWSLAVEEHFYLVWPLVIFFCSRKQAIVIAASAAALAAIGRIGWTITNDTSVAVDVATWFRCDALLIGSIFALLLRGNLSLNTYRWLGWVALISGLALSAPWIMNPESRLKTIPHTSFAILFGGLVALAATSSAKSWTQRIWNNRVLALFGRYSYAMYVFQAPLIPLMAPLFSTALLSDLCGSLLLARLLYITGMTILTFGLALASWHLLEKHCLKLKKRFELRNVVSP